MNIDMNKYEKSFIKKLNMNNIKKIVSFLKAQNCDYIDELLEDYLDIFTFEYDDFIARFNKLDEKYDYNLINEIKEDMNILEELYY